MNEIKDRLGLDPSESLVLFELLSRELDDQNEEHIRTICKHPAELAALNNLLCILERTNDAAFRPDYAELLETARMCLLPEYKTIALTNFCLRQWDEAAGRKKIIGLSPGELATLCNEAVSNGVQLVDGYARFCKHLFLENPSPTPCSFAPVTDENRGHLKSGYMARRDGELAVLERWFEDIDPPRANWLDVILYSRAQLEIEAADGPDKDDLPDCDWGIVSIIGTLEPVEPPMPPITQMRNALGTSEGGSGVAIDREAYARAVDFWEHHASVL